MQAQGEMNLSNKYVAHYREYDGQIQTVREHIEGVSLICGELTAKIGIPSVGVLLGLLHDFGKYSSRFQNYIKSAVDLIDPDIDEQWVNAAGLKGKIDHSSAGAQWLWDHLSNSGTHGRLLGQIVAICLVSHHGGMLDCLSPDGENTFLKRITKDDRDTHMQECRKVCEEELLGKVAQFVSDDFLKIFWKKVADVYKSTQQEQERLKMFRLGFLTRYLFSCLIDADRIDSADFENPENRKLRSKMDVDWAVAIIRMENILSGFKVRNEIDTVRNRISEECFRRASEPQGIYTLTVPTGGGKTFTSIRYGLHHAQKHNLDHIFYIIPYTSIIEQNAQIIRDVLEDKNDDFPWVLEHHSNLEPEKQSWRAKLTAENWDAPIVFTTMVQFLEALFCSGTRGARRLHNLANSLIIFDEIQSLPVTCVHLFNNALQFMVEHAGSTALLCTATQPLLGGVNPDFGALDVPPGNELVPDTQQLFAELKRVDVIDRTKPGGWSEDEIASLIQNQFEKTGSCLVVVNTKDWARKLYDRCWGSVEDGSLFHLSTNLCPTHRKEILAEVTDRLKKKESVLCISTQLIEAGVDVDFNCVIRFLAGLDSIAQAAGRCNRNGNLDTSDVLVVNPADESITMLKDIKIGQEKTMRVFSEAEHHDFLSPTAIERYFSYYFYERAELMHYPLTAKQAGRPDTMLNLLSDNPLNVCHSLPGQLRQAFRTAGEAFKAIDAPTQGVIVPHKQGKDIIARLCADCDPATTRTLLADAQKYSVNVFPNVWESLLRKQAIHPVRKGEAMYYLDERYYSDHFGLSTEIVSGMDCQIV